MLTQGAARDGLAFSSFVCCNVLWCCGTVMSTTRGGGGGKGRRRQAVEALAAADAGKARPARDAHLARPRGLRTEQ